MCVSPAHFSPWDDSGDPQRPQKQRVTPGEEA
jgi:hypothetical protein